MPRRVLILLGAVALTLAAAACKNDTSVSPTPAPSVSFTPNPQITAATITVTIQQSPAAHVSVQESTPKPSETGRPGTPFATQKTGKKGQTIFTHLKPSQTYCWVAILGPNQTSSRCAGWEVWQFQPISLGT